MPAKKKVVKKEEVVELPAINREHTSPCNKCRKRTCCILRPYEGRCMGLEEGDPWVYPEYMKL